MTKRWSSTASLDGRTKRQASKDNRREGQDEVLDWLRKAKATESRTYDECTGRPMRTFTIDLTKEGTGI